VCISIGCFVSVPVKDEEGIDTHGAPTELLQYQRQRLRTLRQMAALISHGSLFVIDNSTLVVVDDQLRPALSFSYKYLFLRLRSEKLLSKRTQAKGVSPSFRHKSFSFDFWLACDLSRNQNIRNST